MLTIGTAGSPQSYTISKWVDWLAENKLNALELQFLQGPKLDNWKQIRNKAEENEISLSAHAPYKINLAASQQSRIEESIQAIYKSAELLDKVNGQVLTIHPGYYSDSKEKTLNRITRNLKKSLERLESEMLDVTLGVETSGKKKQFGLLQEIYDLVENLGFEIIPVIDFAHIQARSKNFKHESDFQQVIDLFRGKINHYHFHIACVKAENQEEARHLSLEKKQPDYKNLLKPISDIASESSLILETPQLKKNSLKLKNWIEQESEIKR